MKECSLCVLFHVLNPLADFRKIWYEQYVIGDHLNAATFKFLQSVITTWQTCELVKSE
jgi:hypothetical protein